MVTCACSGRYEFISSTSGTSSDASSARRTHQSSKPAEPGHRSNHARSSGKILFHPIGGGSGRLCRCVVSPFALGFRAKRGPCVCSGYVKEIACKVTHGVSHMQASKDKGERSRHIIPLLTVCLFGSQFLLTGWEKKKSVTRRSHRVATAYAMRLPAHTQSPGSRRRLLRHREALACPKIMEPGTSRRTRLRISTWWIWS